MNNSPLALDPAMLQRIAQIKMQNAQAHMMEAKNSEAAAQSILQGLAGGTMPVANNGQAQQMPATQPMKKGY